MIEAITQFPSTEELESLFVNNQSMTKIETHLNRFNPIRVMKIERKEIRHSAILSWLLNPGENHGLGDKFLKAFLGEALRGHSSLGSPTALDIARADLRDSTVRREWQNIDIFIYSEKNAWGFVIENKFDSKQHEGQLAKYLDGVSAGLGKLADNLSVRGIFLTLHDEEPEDARYAPINYEAICQFLPRFIGQEAHLLTAEVRTFLQHYNEIIAEETGMNAESNEMEKLARQLYRENKKALDFIMQHGAGSDFAIAAEDVFGDGRDYLDLVEIDGHKYRFGYSDHKMVSFLPESWFLALGKDKYNWKGCEQWLSGYPLISWLQLRTDADETSGQLGLYGEVGPLKEYEFRSSLINAIQSAGENLPKSRIKFQKAAADECKQYSKFLKKNFLKIKDVQDAEEIAEGMKKLLQRFQPEFDGVGSILTDFKKYGYVDK
jgi:hypothetical protein